MQDYYAFGMQMPGRKSSGGYRYGFNGKENDNEVKGEGNQQDYGMRIYDGRIGKFLSVDPLTKNFPWYTPYQFSGNSPIGKTDLDGGEPQDFKSKWKYQPLFNLKTGGKVKGTGTEIFVSDSKLGGGLRDVSLVYDEVTMQNWFVHQSGNKNYYLKNENGNNSVMTIDSKTYQVKGGEFVEFESQDQVQSRLGVELANNMEKSIFGITIGINAGFASAGVLQTNGGTAAVKWAFENLVKSEGSWIKLNIASGLGDFSFQTVKNEGRFWENNLVSTAGNLFLGSIPSAMLSSSFDINFKSGKLNSKVTSENWLKNVSTNALGNYLGSVLGNGLAGKTGVGLPFSSNKITSGAYNTFGNTVANSIPAAFEQPQKKK